MYADKSMALEPLMRLFDRWRQERFVVIHSLQVGTDADQLNPWRSERGIVDHSEQIGDFLDTACLISQFDLVISVDTAVFTSPELWMYLSGPCFSTIQIAGCAVAVTPLGTAYDIDAPSQARDWDSVLEQVDRHLNRLLGRAE